MRLFKLVRKVDVSGVSGVGTVAEGVIFADGTVALHWFGEFHTTEIVDSVEDVLKIHGHQGSTTVEYEEC